MQSEAVEGPAVQPKSCRNTPGVSWEPLGATSRPRPSPPLHVLCPDPRTAAAPAAAQLQGGRVSGG
eukprot:CAMPEP_0170330700 /NCGR_PEP_ID=MMETSP0116_2-20130129/66295_1 /TAXON_ID=400756 /ORGANISM="Durinskia baltica, Strain CSIRO CS-38" /LENGTH=65 /DNA_ID=CAMNT_0010583893 /DNA_START=52 /DNA_END=245 /DNA_ORIENTATION=+